MEQMTEQEELKMFWESELHYLLMLLEDHKKDVLDKLPKGKDLYGKNVLIKVLLKKFNFDTKDVLGGKFSNENDSSNDS